MLTMGKFHNSQPFTRGCGGSGHHQRHILKFFDSVEQNDYLKNFNQAIIGKKERGRGISCPPFFGHLKMTLELLIFI